MNLGGGSREGGSIRRHAALSYSPLAVEMTQRITGNKRHRPFAASFSAPMAVQREPTSVKTI